MTRRGQRQTNSKPNIKRLANCTIFLCGKLSQPHLDINKIITSQGGTVDREVSETTTFLISSQVSVNNKFKAIQYARKRGIPIYLLSYLLDINSDRNEHLIEDNENLIQDNEHLENQPTITLQNPKPRVEKSKFRKSRDIPVDDCEGKINPENYSPIHYKSLCIRLMKAVDPLNPDQSLMKRISRVVMKYAKTEYLEQERIIWNLDDINKQSWWDKYIDLTGDFVLDLEEELWKESRMELA